MKSFEDVIGRIKRMGIDPTDLNSEIEQLEYEISTFLNEEGAKCQSGNSNRTNGSL